MTLLLFTEIKLEWKKKKRKKGIESEVLLTFAEFTKPLALLDHRVYFQ